MSGKTAQFALEAAIRKGILGSPTSISYESGKPQPAALFYDLDEFEANLKRVQEAFGKGSLHAMAIKSNPVHAMVKILVEKGCGAECASIGEVLNALEAGMPPENIVYDSPVKTESELKFALEKGIHLNVDNFQELQVLTEMIKDQSNVKGTIGLRINPLMAAGDIKALSVSLPDSKFAVPITESTREEVIGWFVERPWLTCVHVHIGSQSYGVDGLSEGAKHAVDFAKEINKRVGFSQIDTIDIGGGMGVNRVDDSISPSYQDYANSLKKIVPEVFPERGVFKKLITEFGQSLNAKTGWIASRVEYTKKVPDQEHTIALIHIGADMCMRTCYNPNVKKYQRRVEVFDGNGAMKTGEYSLHNIAGPLCFAGDVVSKEVMLPQVERGDFVILHDCGANSIATFSRHCSRFVPSVIGYRVNENHQVEFEVLKQAETADQLLQFWGGGKIEFKNQGSPAFVLYADGMNYSS